MRRISVLLLVMAMALVVASPVGAAKPAVDCDKKPNHPLCGDGPQGLVEVSIEANLTKAHEAGDTIYYTFVVTNGLDEDEVVTVTDELGTLNGTVLAGGSATFERSYVLDDTDMETETLTNTVTATAPSETRQATATVEVDKYELCDREGNGVFSTDASVCIWKPGPGNWKISVVPDSNRSTRVMITVRDHVPGNWCRQGITDRWRPGDDPVETTVSIPEWDSDTWAGEAICPIGGAAGDFYDVGTPSSFYLDTKGNVTVTSAD